MRIHNWCMDPNLHYHFKKKIQNHDESWGWDPELSTVSEKNNLQNLALFHALTHFLLRYLLYVPRIYSQGPSNKLIGLHMLTMEGKFTPPLSKRVFFIHFFL